jgi:hypothetical protein
MPINFYHGLRPVRQLSGATNQDKAGLLREIRRTPQIMEASAPAI